MFNQLDLLQGRKKVTIPFNYVNNFIILDVKIFGSLPIHLIFDTGSEHVIIFKRQYTDLLQVPYDRRIPIMGSDLSRQIYALVTRNSVLEVNGLPAIPYDLLILEEDYFNLEELIGTSIDGLIGGGFFKNLIIQIDYRNLRMTLHDPNYFETPEGYTILPIKIKINKPYVDGLASLQDGSVVQVDLLVDTGAGVPLLLHTNSHPSLKLPEHIIRGKLGMGLGGYLEGYIGRINKLQVGNIEFPGIVTSFQDIKEEFLVNKDRFRNGILGNQLLSRFSVFFDYNRSQLIVKPYQSRQKPFQMDKSGLVIFAFGQDFKEFIVKDIIPNSPAAEVDILPEDVILSMQGYPAHFYTLASINSTLQKKAGKKIKLILNRNGKKIRRVFSLRDLI
ncbi:MAG TPA: hypothetical protein VMZ69_09615 [Saprospiraceae bacterium]|nr:hypothetical protein [Saprospiraceae bacterium]